MLWLVHKRPRKQRQNFPDILRTSTLVIPMDQTKPKGLQIGMQGIDDDPEQSELVPVDSLSSSARSGMLARTPTVSFRDAPLMLSGEPDAGSATMYNHSAQPISNKTNNIPSVGSPLRPSQVTRAGLLSKEGSSLARSKTMPSNTKGIVRFNDSGSEDGSEMVNLSKNSLATANNSITEPASRASTDLRRNKSLPYRAIEERRLENEREAKTNASSNGTPLLRSMSFAKRPAKPLQRYNTLGYPKVDRKLSTVTANVASGSTSNAAPKPIHNLVIPSSQQMALASQSSPLSALSFTSTNTYNEPAYPPLMAPPLNTSQITQRRGMHITAVNYVTHADTTTPYGTPQKHLPPLPPQSGLHRKNSVAASIMQKLPIEWQEQYKQNIHGSYKFRAFGRKAISFQQRQWFTNICCVSLCPLMMVLVSFVLKFAIANLSNNSNNNYQILYCSSALSINEQNWPIFNLSGIGIATSSPSLVPNADSSMPVRHANYFSRASLVDLSSKDVFSQLSSTTVAGGMPCVNWFGGDYPRNDESVYERVPRTSTHPEYAFKDSLYVSELNSGWLDLLQPLLTFADPARQAQALSLARSFALYQMRPWAVVSLGPNVNPNDIGSSPKQPLLADISQIPNTFFTPASTAKGMLDTIEPRYNVEIRFSPPGLGGAQKVPYFNITNSANVKDMDALFYSTIQQAISNLARVDSSALQGNPSDIQMALVLGNLNKAYSNVPYAGIGFKTVDHSNKKYSYILQVGKDQRLERTPGFPLAGLRMLLQQAQLSNAIVRFSSPKLASTVITQGLRNFPFLAKPSFDIPFGSIIGRILYPLGISFLLPIFTISLVRDKESKIVTMMRMNGLGSPAAYYLSEYITFFLTFLVSTAIFWVSGYLTSLELFSKTDPLLLAILFFLWGNIQVTLSMFFNSLFRQSRFALISVFLIVVCGVVTSFILDEVFSGSSSFPTILFVWPPFAFYRALGVLNNAATSSQQTPYSVSRLVPGDEVFTAVMTLFAEIFAYLLLSVYLGNVIKSEFGSNKPWHYPVTQYMKPSAPKLSKIDDEYTHTLDHNVVSTENEDVRAERIRVLNEQYEKDAPLVMRNMVKEYTNESGKKKTAVNNITLAVENNTVFGLLGPNGAGKTSLISILTGVYEPTTGNATLGGHDIIKDADAAFRSIGVCPQFDILWDDLTVDEHLFFYARLKGVFPEFEREAVVAAMELVKLETMRSRRVKNLSGGEKRRLSIAIALVADPKVVFLDEPTTGLDPEVRRTVWDVIARARGNCAILMTTHSMEEAEVCCQCIGIMAKGTMRCIGSTTTLKDSYGSGYKLSIYGEYHRLDSAEQFLNSLLPNCEFKRIQTFNNVRVYVFLPKAQELAFVFDAMAREHSRYGIQNWGISQTTLDEIFTNLITEDDAS
ncbi:hypothetical protein BDV3_002117 [Batrachochytrium dendrobatidis]